MRIGFYNPYFDGLGGGERYTLTLASHWSKNHNAELFWDDEKIINSAEKRFGIDLSRVKITQNIFRGKNILKKLYLSRTYDLIFFLSDGSIPSTLATYNILHFQVPFPELIVNQIKLSRYQAIVCNSLFTKTHLDFGISKKASVIYPPVRTSDLKSSKKKKQILSVGRFSNYFQAKKQQILIETFRRGLDTGRFTGWRLILAGGVLSSDEDYFARLKKQSHGMPIDFYPNATYTKLTQLYSESMIYWHAAGFEETDPTHAEHFGISTVEAMAAGCIPVVYNGGGQPEIVEHKKSGFLWQTEAELIDYTVALESKNTLHSTMQKDAQSRAKKFDEKNFMQAFDTLLHDIVK